MERFVRASKGELGSMLLRAGRDGVHIEQATYPPGCKPPSGSLRIRPLGPGGFMVHVERRTLETDDFRLHVLFKGGECVFISPADLARFFRGPVARAFGIDIEPLPYPAAEPAPEETSSLEPAPKRRPRQKARRAKAPCGRAPSREQLAGRLGLEIRGQDVAVGRIADVVSAHLAKTEPARPESVLLIGPSGCGKTSAIEALPRALGDLGCEGSHVFRVDCNELTERYDVHRFLGAAPGLVGYRDEPPLVAALSKPRCIVLLDELEKAHEDVHTVFLGLLDEGRLTAPNGTSVRAPDAVVAMTTNLGAADLAYELHDAPPHDRWRQQVCRDHLLRLDWPTELVGRIGAFAVFEPLEHDAVRQIAGDAIRSLGQEYGLEVEDMPPVIVDVVLDLADASDIGARAVNYAARDLLGQPFAAAARDGVRGQVSLDTGPPPRVLVRDPCLF